MGSHYLLDLADWCRDAGLRVVEESGWEYRARSSGGYDAGKPWCVMWHHTASKTSAANDVYYICHGNPDAPVANLYLARDGTVYVCAGGASNTNGKGGPFTVSKGTVPADQMNTYAVSIEAGNDGVGEPWPQEQIDAYFALNDVLTSRLGLAPSDCCTHNVWAPTRKIDPATADAVQGAWQPHDTTSSGTWSLDDIQVEALARSGEPPAPTPDPPDPLPPLPGPIPEEDTDMRLVAAIDANGTIWIGDGMQRRAVPSMEVFNNYVVLSNSGGSTLYNTSGQPVRQTQDVQEVGDDTVEALGVRIG